MYTFFLLLTAFEKGTTFRKKRYFVEKIVLQPNKSSKSVNVGLMQTLIVGGNGTHYHFTMNIEIKVCNY